MDRWWWMLFTVVAAALLGAMVAAGMADRELPGRLVVEGGPVSVVTETAWLLAAVLAIVAAIGSPRGGRVGWTAIAALAVLAWGEESEWSIDLTHHRVVGDVHNLASHALLDWLGPPLTAAIAAVIAATAIGWLMVSARRRAGPVRWLGPHAMVGMGLLGLAALLDLWAESPGPYVMGFWPLEESLELLSAVAVLGAPLRAIVARSSRAPAPEGGVRR